MFCSKVTETSPVNGRDVGVDIGRIALGVGARFEFQMASGKGATEREGPVHRLAVGRHGAGSDARLLVEQEGIRVVDAEGGCGAVPFKGEPA